MFSACHPQTDSQSEVTVKALQHYLRSFVNYKPDDWDLHLTGAEFAYNFNISTTTQLSPFAVTDRHQPSTPALFLKPAVAKLSQYHVLLPLSRHLLRMLYLLRK
jgi:hypothetical protein